MSRQFRVATLLIAAVSTTSMVAGCSKSSGSASTGTAGGTTATVGATTTAAATTAAAAATAIANAGGESADISKQCAAMKPADVQALMKAPVTAVVVDPGECSFYGGDLKIDLFPNDPTQKYYQNPVGALNTTALSGVGDQAQWFQPVAGASTPWVEAHKGSLTCVLSPADASETKMTYTGSSPFYKIATADAAAYAQEEGKLCNDAFGAS